LLRNDFADLILDRLENRFGAFDPGAGGRADVKWIWPPSISGKKSGQPTSNIVPPRPSINAATIGNDQSPGEAGSASNFEYPSRSRSKPRSNAPEIREKKPVGVASSVRRRSLRSSRPIVIGVPGSAITRRKPAFANTTASPSGVNRYLAGPSREHHRGEHAADGKRSNQRRHRDFGGAVQRRLGKRHALLGP